MEASVQLQPLERAIEAMRQRADRLEREAVALRAELDEMAIMLSWQAARSVSPMAWRRIPISEAEIAAYLEFVGSAFEPGAIRLFLQSHKAATQLKRALPTAEQAPALQAIVTAMRDVAVQANLHIPEELEAAVGD